MKFSFFNKLKITHSPQTVTAGHVADLIRGEKYKIEIEKIRSCSDKKERDELKRELLPLVCFSGTFETRSSKGLKKHSGLICLDFDGVPDEEIIPLKDKLAEDPHTHMLFISPSGNGLKQVVKIPNSARDHKKYFKALIEHFDTPYIDKGTSDITRGCNLSYDPDLYFNENSETWVKMLDEVPVKIKTREDVIISLKSEDTIITRLLTWWKKGYGMKKGERHTNLYILAAAFSKFGILYSSALGICLSLEDVDFTEEEITSTVKDVYDRHKHQFGTEQFEDREAVRKLEMQIHSGDSVRQIYLDNPGIVESEAEMAQIYEAIIKRTPIEQFWDYNEKGKLELNHFRFKRYLSENGFFKYFPYESDRSALINIDGKVADLVSPENIKDFVLCELSQRKDASYEPFNFMAEKTKYFEKESLNLVETIDVSVPIDTDNTCHLFYKNCIVLVGIDSVETFPYEDIDGYVWKRHIINRNFGVSDNKDSVFKQFIWLVASRNEQRYCTLMSVIGYYLHGYKDRSTSKIVVLNDEVIDETPNGGSGKGIFARAIGFMKRMISLDGKMFRTDDPFAYQRLSEDTQVLVFDDVKRNFTIEPLFSISTDGLTIQRKYEKEMRLPPESSPKILVLTNYALAGTGGSVERRQFDVEFSSHFSAQHTPVEEFGHLLFDEWDFEEWARFDNYMVECVQFYLNNGLVQSGFKNLVTRKFIQNTCYEFYEWAEGEDPGLPINVKIYRNAIFDEFISEHSDKKNLSKKRFTLWIKKFAEFKGYQIKEGRDFNSGRWTIVYDKDRPAAEEIKRIIGDTEAVDAPF